MVSSDSPQTQTIPERDQKARKASTGTRIAAGITCLLILPLVFLGFALGGLFELVLCALVVLSLHRLLTRPSYASVVYAGALLAIPVMILCLLFVPGFLAYREHVRVAVAVGTTESIRAAMASYAANSTVNSFPATVADWGSLTRIVNANGATLKTTAAKQGFDLRGYTASDSDSDGIVEDYTMSFLVDGVPDADVGRLILVSPSGIDKTTP